MSLKYTPRTITSFIEDDFDFEFAMRRKPVRKHTQPKIEPLELTPAETAIAKIAALEVEPILETTPSIKIQSKIEDLRFKPSERIKPKTEDLVVEPSKPILDIEDFLIRPSRVAHKKKIYKSPPSESKTRHYLVLATRIVIMPIVAFAIAFLLYTLIDTFFEFQQNRRFHRTASVSLSYHHIDHNLISHALYIPADF